MISSKNTPDNEPPVSKLYNWMAKLGLTPIFEELPPDIDQKQTKGMHKTMVSCPIALNGPPVTAESHWCCTKKEAKHVAAQAFIDKYLLDGNNKSNNNNNKNNKSVTVKRPKPTCIININPGDIRNVLQSICIKNDFVLVEDVSEFSTENSVIFRAVCSVSNICTKAESAHKERTKIKAAMKMLQILMNEMGVYEVFLSPDLNKSTESNEIICFDDHFTATPNKAVVGIFGRMKSSKVPPQVLDTNSTPHVEAPQPNETPNVAKAKVETTDNHENIAKVMDKGKGPVPKCVKNSEDCYQKDGAASRTTNEPVNCRSNHADIKVTNLDVTKVDERLTKLQAVSMINRILASCDKQLQDVSVKIMKYLNLQHERNVTISFRQYRVVIDQNNSTKIYDGHFECNDQTIKIACLTKLLIDLKEDVHCNHR